MAIYILSLMAKFIKSDEYHQLNTVFDALANETRRDIIHRLSHQPFTISKLAEPYGITLPSMNKHLAVLEKADLIQRKKVGRSNIIALKREALGFAQQWIRKYHTYWGNDRETLENYRFSLPE